jgi:phosphinothricin acetyltransferase
VASVTSTHTVFEVLVRLANADDLERIVEIYNFAVASGHATFDTEPIDAADRADWFATFAGTGRYRCLVAADSTVHGYECSRPYREHPAFDHTVELSVYLAPESRSQGIGTLLYEHLLDHLASTDVHLCVAGIALPNPASVALHERVGFTKVGVFEEYAVKHGEWISSVWMQRRAR